MENPKSPLLKYTLMFLSVSGVNPLLNRMRGFRDIWTITILIASTAMILMMVVEIIITWSGVSSVKLAIYLPGWLMAIVKHFLLIWNRKKLKGMIATFDRLWPTTKFGPKVQNSIDGIFKKANKYNMSFGGWVGLNIAVIIVPWVFAEQRYTLYVSYLFCDIQNNLCFGLYSAFHLFCLLAILPSSIGFDMFFVVLVTYPYAGLEMIKRSFTEMDLLSNAQDSAPEIVHQHNLILKYIKEFNSFMAFILMLQFWISMWQLVVSWFMLAFKGLPPSVEDFTEYGVLACSLMMQLMIYIIGGTLIYEQALSVGDAAFAVDWDRSGQTKLRESLAFIIQRTQKVTRLTVGYIYNLSLLFFVSTVRQSLSLFTLLRAISIKAGEIESIN